MVKCHAATVASWHAFLFFFEEFRMLSLLWWVEGNRRGEEERWGATYERSKRREEVHILEQQEEHGAHALAIVLRPFVALASTTFDQSRSLFCLRWRQRVAFLNRDAASNDVGNFHKSYTRCPWYLQKYVKRELSWRFVVQMFAGIHINTNHYSKVSEGIEV